MNATDLPFYLEPQWLIPLFVVMWFFIGAVLSRISGWASLATHFRATQAESGERFRFASGSMGVRFFPVSYGGCLFLSVNNDGLHLSIMFPFRFQCPPLFIPWSQLESVEEKRFLFFRYTVIHLRNQWPIISVRGRAGEFIKKAYTSASSKNAL